MNLFTEFFLAWKYFKPKRSAVSVITLISVVGVSLGVAVLIVVLAVMTGFTDQLKNKLLETGAHAQIQKQTVYSYNDYKGKAGTFDEDEAQKLVDEAQKLGAAGVPVLASPVLLQVGDTFNPKALLAFDPKYAEGAEKHFSLKSAIIYGSYPVEKDQIIISSVIASEFGLGIGDKILLHSPSKLSRLIDRDADGKFKASDNAQYYLPGEYTVAAIYKFGKYDFDKNVMFLNLDDADELFGLDWGVSTHIYLWVQDPFHINPFLQQYRSRLAEHSPNAVLRSWEEMHQQILGVLNVEKNMMFFLLVFIVLVAAFSITNTLITTVIQKTKEIGLLKSMGATSGVVLRVFLLQGLFVGVIGTSFGILLGYLIVLFRMDILNIMRRITGQQIFPAEIYIFDQLPAHIIWGDV